MNLTPEQKAIGQANFNAANASEFTRREFMGAAVAAGAVSGTALASFYFGYHDSLDKLKADPVRVAVIGTGDEGSVLIGAHTPEYLDIVAICDIRPYNIHRAFHGDTTNDNTIKVRPGLMALRKWKTEDTAREHIKVYTDYKDVLKDKNIEAVIIALPLFLHDVVAIEAMQAGKHVLTEKLMAYSVHQCKNMARVSKQTQKLLATGHQRHYSMLYADAVNTLKLGLIGDVHHIRAQWHRGADSWKPQLADEGMIKDLAAVQASLDEEKAKKSPSEKRLKDFAKKIELFKLKLMDKDVDAAKYGYQSKTLAQGYQYSPYEELMRWRLWNRTGGGLMAELGSHQLDASGIFCSAQRTDGSKALPLTVSAEGVRFFSPEDREVDDHVYCRYEYPSHDYDPNDKEKKNKKICVTYSSINGNGFGGYGEVVMGTKGTLVLDMETQAMLFKDSSLNTKIKVVKDKSDKPATAVDTTESGAPAVGSGGSKAVSRGYTEEMEHWAWCIRNFDYEHHQPKCQPKVAMADAIIALTTNIAIQEGRRIEFKPEWFDIDSDETPEGVKPTVPVKG